MDSPISDTGVSSDFDRRLSGSTLRSQLRKRFLSTELVVWTLTLNGQGAKTQTHSASE